VQFGNVLFPRHGAEQLIEQLVGFGLKKRGDLADSFSILLSKVQEKNKAKMTFVRVDDNSKMKLMTPEEIAEQGLRLEQEYERGLFNDSMDAGPCGHIETLKQLYKEVVIISHVVYFLIARSRRKYGFI